MHSVLQAIENEFAAKPPNPEAGSMRAQLQALDIIGKATKSVKMESGQSIGALPGQGDVVLQNVGAIITTINPSGRITVTNADGQVVLDLHPR